MYTSGTNCQQNYSLDPLIIGIMNEKNAIALKILNHIIYLSTRFKTVYVSQGTIAAMFDVTREWVNKLLGRWKVLGVIKYRQQDFNRSCIYYISPLLNQEKNRIKFQLPAAGLLLAVSALVSAVWSGEFTLSNIRKYIYKNSYRIVNAGKIDYGFEEARGPKEAIFILNNNQLCPESVMQEQSIINLIATTYYLSIEQQQLLSRYNDEALRYAVKELYRQGKQKSLLGAQSATSWFSAVAASFEKKAALSKTGRSMDQYQKKIVNATFNANHSPASIAPKMDNDERISFLQSESIKIKDLIAQAENGRTMYGGSEYGRRMLQNVQEELDKLLGKKQNYLDYESHLDDISQDKSDSSGYKELVRRYDYNRTARKL